MDDNVNRLSETIFLLSFYDALIAHFDNRLKYLKISDAAGFLNAEFQTNEELEGYTVWLEHALKDGRYTPRITAITILV